MTTIVVNERTKEGKALLELVNKMSSVEILQEPNDLTKQAIDDARQKKGTKGKNKADFFAKLKA
jgi:hypothetical protein